MEVWLSNPVNVANIPILNAATLVHLNSAFIQAGSLVRFRGMIQDTSFGQEVYISRYANGHEWKFNAYRDHNPDELSSETEQEQGANFIVERTSMEDRDLWYAVSTPGLSGWTGQAQVSGENQGIRTENPKYPLAGQPHIGVVLKFYGLDPNHPPAGVADLVDIIGVAGTCYSSQDHVIHVLALRK
ncbi:hypothetical protein DSO57_1011695, partial [Entomophthora muscae]